MNKKILIGILLVVVVFIAGIFLWNSVALSPISKEEESQVSTLVGNFGSKLKEVYISDLKEIASAKIKEIYALFVTPELLLAWMNDSSKAPGRVVSSSWPEKIEIISMEKLDPNTIKVKGKIIYVASGGENKLEETNEDPIILIVSDNNERNTWLIDNAWYGEYAFYSSKELLKTLKDAFLDMNIIGDGSEPYVAESIDITGDYTPEAIVDMQTGGAYTEYYTVCRFVNGKLEVAKFEDEIGSISSKFFDEGASVKHEVKLSFLNDSKGNNVLYHYEIERNDSGEVSSITVEAYRWNEGIKLFKYSEEISQEIKKELEECLVPKPIDLSSLKFKEIRSEFSAIDSVAVYNGKVAFSCGSGKIKPNMPKSANINHIVVYDVKSGKVEYSKEVSKNWLMIDDVQMNDNWVLFSAIEDPVGVPIECFAINRKTGELTKLLQNYNWDKDNADENNNFIASHILLQGDYAHIALEKTENGNSGKTTKLIRINLDNGTVQNYFEKKSKSFAVSHLWVLKGDCIAFSASEMAESGDINQYVYLYSFMGRSSDTVSIPKSIDVYVLTSDEKIIYYYQNGNIVIAPLRKPDDFEEIGLEVFNPSILLNNTATSDDYIVASLDNSDIFIYNRKTKERAIIKGIGVKSEIALNAYELSIIKRPENASDSIIYIDLKENRF